MFCTACGNAIKDGDRFCSGCGAQVTAAATSPPIEPAPAAGEAAQETSTAAEPLAAPAPPTAPSPPAPPEPPATGPAPVPRKRRDPALIVAIVAGAIVVLAGIGLGLFFALGDGDAQEAASTTTVASIPPTTTSAAPTTTAIAITTTTTAAPTTTTVAATTTTAEPTTTTDGETAVLTARAAEWLDLLESIPGTKEDLTAKIAAFLTPKSEAAARAAEYQEAWRTPADPADIIEADPWDKITRVTFSGDGSRAVTVLTVRLRCRDGLTTRGIEALGWKKEDGTWLRTIDYDPLGPAKGAIVAFGSSVKVGPLVWAPVTVHELKHLGVGEGPTAIGMFLTVDFFVRNEGTKSVVPGDFTVTATAADGKILPLSKAADKWWTEDAGLRSTAIPAGDWTYLWYTFDAPAGVNLHGLKYKVTGPGA